MTKNLLLKIENISSGYGSTIIVNNFSFEIQKGNVLAITGSNGMGKTTLMKTIMGLIEARNGTITFKGEDITNSSPDYRSKLGIGYVPQGREIFSALSVEQNIMLPIYTRKKNSLNTKDKLEEIYSLFTILKEKRFANGSSLSGGQQQQLAIARALIFDPEIIILDEPAEGIQPSIIQDIGRAIDYLRQKKNITILLVEQYFEFARDLADSFIVMDRGQVVMRGRGNTMIEEDVRQYLTV